MTLWLSILEAQPACSASATHSSHSLQLSQLSHLLPYLQPRTHQSRPTIQQQSQPRHTIEKTDKMKLTFSTFSIVCALVETPPLTLALEDLKQQKFVIEAEPSETVSLTITRNVTCQRLTLRRSAKSSQRSHPRRAGSRRHRSSSTRVRFCKTTRPSSRTRSRRRASLSA
jgi:hypothetical protein